MDNSIFKDYDIRGTYPDQLNAGVARQLAYAIVRTFQPKKVAICRDMRLSGGELYHGFAEVFTRLGVDVWDAGLTGTEIQYYIAATQDVDLVLMISASHNPANYNGLKLVKKGPVAVTGDSGLSQVRDAVALGPLEDAAYKGTVTPIDVYPGWRDKVLSLVDVNKIKHLSVVADAGNGMAGKLFPLVAEKVAIKLTPLYFELDGRFPNHVPNPLVEKNNDALVAKIKEIGADLGVTFDGDADRMFLVDDTERLVSGTITTALLARYFLKKYPGEHILYNAICGRIVPETIVRYGGTGTRVRVGHSYIKTYMRQSGAIFAGEHSGHYYYRDFFSAESGALSALLAMVVISQDGRKLSAIVDELSKYKASGEINFRILKTEELMDTLKHAYKDAKRIDELDGLSIWFDDWWCNVRVSHTEPLVRLNVEADTQELLSMKTEGLIATIEKAGGVRQT